MTKDEALKLALEKFEFMNHVDSIFEGEFDFQINAIKEALAQPEQEPVAWEGGEGWESLAWELCADKNGEDSCNELIWEGGPIPEPWGDRWMKYEEEAKRLIALVQKHTTPPQQEPVAQCTESDSWNCKYCRKTESCKALQDPRNFASPPQRKPLTDEEIGAILEGVNAYGTRLYTFARAIEAKLKEKNHG